MPARDFMPGVPAAGHITTSGYWHPGGLRNCHKHPCKADNARSQPHHYVADPGRRDGACRECRQPEDFYRHKKAR